MIEIHFITSKEEKVFTANKTLHKYGVNLLHEDMETPEIQNLEVSNVAAYSAEFAAKKINKPTIVTDSGLCIESLNNFPGALLKYMNIWFQPEDILSLMKDRDNRMAIALDCLAYCEPNKKPILFTSKVKCTIAKEKGGSGSTIDQLLIWPKFQKVQGLVPKDVMFEYWSKNNKIYDDFGKFIRK